MLKFIMQHSFDLLSTEIWEATQVRPFFASLLEGAFFSILKARIQYFFPETS